MTHNVTVAHTPKNNSQNTVDAVELKEVCWGRDCNLTIFNEMPVVDLIQPSVPCFIAPQVFFSYWYALDIMYYYFEYQEHSSMCLRNYWLVINLNYSRSWIYFICC